MKGWGVLAAIASLAGFIEAQSLGDAARKERERREKARGSGAAARTITEEDLAANKGALANDPRERPAARADAAETPAKPEPARAQPSPEKRGEEYWRSRVAQARSRLDTAQRRRDEFRMAVQWGQAEQYDENGKRVIHSIYKMKELADAADRELAAARPALEDLLEEARRAGALPGWLR